MGDPLERDISFKTSESENVCPHNSILSNVTLAGGIKAGVFTSHGVVDSFNDCLQHCCGLPICDAAFMVKRTCFSLRCSSHDLCETRKARPSTYHPMVSFLKRFNPVEDKGIVVYYTDVHMHTPDFFLIYIFIIFIYLLILFFIFIFYMKLVKYNPKITRFK